MSARVHFAGICGKAMGAIAMALAEAGHRVTGSDEHVYPPMPDRLAAAGIAVATPFAAANLPPDADVVVIGRRLSAENPEVLAARGRAIPCVSFPELLRRWFVNRSRNLVVSGGVGKTTTAAMLAWILERESRRPDFVIGGEVAGLGRSARLGGAPVCVREGDEYASAADDPTPKFLHYRPETLIVTNTLDDHPDLYPDRESLLCAFQAAVRLVPPTGCLIASDLDDATPRLARAAGCSVVSVGETARATVRIDQVELTDQGSSFRLKDAAVRLPLFGRMNLRNAAMAALAAERAGIPLDRAALALESFRAVANRQQHTDTATGTVVTDKATHPGSITELHDALRQQFPGRRLLVFITPRATGGREWIYQRDLPAALARFDTVVVAAPYEHPPPPVTSWARTPFSVDLLLEGLLARGCDARLAAGAELTSLAPRLAGERDVVVLLMPESRVADAAAIAAVLGCQSTNITAV